MTEQVYPIVPPSGSAYLFLIPFAALLVAAIVFVGYSLSGARRTKFILADGSLQITGEIWGRSIPRDHLRWSEARKVDLRRETSLKPRSRTWGTSVPGYNSGWFRLRNDSKALLFVTDRSHVVYVPTTEGYSVMMSVADPSGFLQNARSAK